MLADYKILIVDDEVDYREMFSLILKEKVIAFTWLPVSQKQKKLLEIIKLIW